jgi:hypothetical protein
MIPPTMTSRLRDFSQSFLENSLTIAPIHVLACSLLSDGSTNRRDVTPDAENMT